MNVISLMMISTTTQNYCHHQTKPRQTSAVERAVLLVHVIFLFLILLWLLPTKI